MRFWNPRQVDERLISLMALLAACGILVTAIGWPLAITVGLALGAVLGILNFMWLVGAAYSIVNAKSPKVPLGVILKFSLRYPVIFGLVYLCYRTGWLPAGAVLTGLFVQVGGLFAEVVFQLVRGGRQSEPAD